MYPLDLMEQVIQKLEDNYKILLFGGGDKEQKLLKTLEEKYDSCISLVGGLTLDEELDVIGNLDDARYGFWKCTYGCHDGSCGCYLMGLPILMPVFHRLISLSITIFLQTAKSSL